VYVTALYIQLVMPYHTSRRNMTEDSIIITTAGNLKYHVVEDSFFPGTVLISGRGSLLQEGQYHEPHEETPRCQPSLSAVN
jgi:hypothetical protein